MAQLVAVSPYALSEVVDSCRREADLFHAASIEQLVRQCVVRLDGELVALVDEVIV